MMLDEGIRCEPLQNLFSPFTSCARFVPQGSLLGPMLLSLYVRPSDQIMFAGVCEKSRNAMRRLYRMVKILKR